MVCERFGWTLDYVESLDPIELDAVTTIVDAVDRGRAHAQKSTASKAKK